MGRPNSVTFYVEYLLSLSVLFCKAQIYLCYLAQKFNKLKYTCFQMRFALWTLLWSAFNVLKKIRETLGMEGNYGSQLKLYCVQTDYDRTRASHYKG